MLDVAKTQAAFIEKAAKLGVTLEPLTVEKGATFQPDTWAWPSSKKVRDCLNALYILSLLQDLCMSEGYESTLGPEDKAQVSGLMVCCSSVEDFIASEIKEAMEPDTGAPAAVAMAQDAPTGDAVAKAAEPEAPPASEPTPPEVAPEGVTKAELTDVTKALDELKVSLAKSSEEVEVLKAENASLKAGVEKALAAPVEPGTPVFKDENGQPTTKNPDALDLNGIQLPFQVVQKAYADSKDMAEFTHRLTRLSVATSVTNALQRK